MGCYYDDPSIPSYFSLFNELFVPLIFHTKLLIASVSHLLLALRSSASCFDAPSFLMLLFPLPYGRKVRALLMLRRFVCFIVFVCVRAHVFFFFIFCC